MIKYFPDHFEDESKYCRVLFIKKYPSSLSDRFINEITYQERTNVWAIIKEELFERLQELKQLTAKG
jgi:hypothetical protein